MCLMLYKDYKDFDDYEKGCFQRRCRQRYQPT